MRLRQLMWGLIVFLLLNLAIWIALVWVAIHFLRKVW